MSLIIDNKVPLKLLLGIAQNNVLDTRKQTPMKLPSAGGVKTIHPPMLALAPSLANHYKPIFPIGYAIIIKSTNKALIDTFSRGFEIGRC